MSAADVPRHARPVFPKELMSRPKRRTKVRENTAVHEVERELQRMATDTPDALAEEVRINTEKNRKASVWNEYSTRILLAPVSPTHSTVFGAWREFSRSPSPARARTALSPSPARMRASSPTLRPTRRLDHGSDFSPHYLWCS